MKDRHPLTAIELRRHGISYPDMVTYEVRRTERTMGRRWPVMAWKCLLCGWVTDLWIDVDAGFNPESAENAARQADAALFHAERCRPS